MIGLLSCNEFSDNTHIEASQLYGAHYLDIVARLAGSEEGLEDAFATEGSPVSLDASSSVPGPIWLLRGVVGLSVLAVFGAARRSWLDATGHAA